jgi:hypothetical protein
MNPKTDPILLRLRGANPTPVREVADASELFAQIVSSTPDSRLARRARPLRRRTLVLVLAVAVLAALASTALALSNWLGDAVKPPVTLREYRAAQHELTLPPGYRWPVLHIESNSVTGRGAGGGRAVLVAQTDWECYWVAAIKRGDSAAQERAHRELTTLLTHNVLVAPPGASENWTPPNPPAQPFVAFAHDGGYAWKRATYVLAAAGNPKRLEESCTANSAG